MNVCMYVRTYVRSYVCTCMYFPPAPAPSRTHVRTYARTYACTYVRTYLHTYVGTLIRVRTCTYVYCMTPPCTPLFMLPSMARRGRRGEYHWQCPLGQGFINPSPCTHVQGASQKPKWSSHGSSEHAIDDDVHHLRTGHELP